MTIAQMYNALSEFFEVYAYKDNETEIETVKQPKFDVLMVRTKDPKTGTIVRLDKKIEHEGVTNGTDAETR